MTYPSRLRLPKARLPELVERHFGLRLRPEAQRDGYRSTAVPMAGREGRFLLKVRDAADREAAGRGCRTAKLLARHGVPTASPVPVKGRPAHVAVEAGHVFTLFEYVDGETFAPEDLTEWREAGRTLARMHGIPAPRAPAPSLAARSLLRDAKESLRGLRERGRTPERILNALEDARRETAETLPPEEHLVLVHGDFRGQNLLFDGSRVRAVLDLDEAGPGEASMDLAYALVFFQAVYRVGPPTPDRTGAFLEGYAGAGPSSPPVPDRLPDRVRGALVRGLALWCGIRAGQENAPAAVDRWIASYLPLLERPESILPGP